MRRITAYLNDTEYVALVWYHDKGFAVQDVYADGKRVKFEELPGRLRESLLWAVEEHREETGYVADY